MKNETLLKIIATLLLLAFGITFVSTPYSQYALAGLYDTNDTAISKVNVTNVAPVISSVILYSNISNVDIDLFPGTITTVYCNATVTDLNGYLDINMTNATLYHITNSSNSADNEIKHYTNASCIMFGGSGSNLTTSCKFEMQYFALNGTWVCNVTVKDQTIGGVFATGQNYTYENITPLVALNVTELIDFGTLAPNENSTSDSNATITNLGNVRIDLNTHGYARNDGDGYAMVCDVGNISIGNEKYNITTPGLNHASMTALTGTIAGFTETSFNLNTANTSAALSSIKTYWKVAVPIGTRGMCNGTIVFNAMIG